MCLPADFPGPPVDTDSALPTASCLDATHSIPTPLEPTENLPLAIPGFAETGLLPNLDNFDLHHDYLFSGAWDWFDSTNPSLAPEYKYNSVVSTRLLEAYYLHFHAAHPILLPVRQRTRQFVKNYPQYLVAVMQCIGSQYESMRPSDGYRNAISQMLASQSKRDGHLVQAMLIFSVALHAQDCQHDARQMLSSAIEIAVELGMNRTNFASENSMGSPFLEESWRRTWWELYVLDGMLAALHQQNSFKLNSIESNLLLPCEDSIYHTEDVCVQNPVISCGWLIHLLEPPQSLYFGSISRSRLIQSRRRSLVLRIPSGSNQNSGDHSPARSVDLRARQQRDCGDRGKFERLATMSSSGETRCSRSRR